MQILHKAVPQSTPLAPAWPMLVRQTTTEILLQARTPMGLIWTLVMTPLLFLMLGVGYAGQEVAGINGRAYMMASFATFGTFNIMLTTFAGTVASDRSARRHVLYRAMPVRPAVLLGAKVITACAMTAVMATIVVGTAIATGTSVHPADVISLVLRVTLGGMSFIALGLAIGYSMRATSVAVVINVLSLGLSILSGIYVPIPVTDGALQPVANVLPTYRLGELAWNAVGAETHNSMISSVIILFMYTVVFGVIALRAYGREEKRTFE